MIRVESAESLSSSPTAIERWLPACSTNPAAYERDKRLAVSPPLCSPLFSNGSVPWLPDSWCSPSWPFVSFLLIYLHHALPKVTHATSVFSTHAFTMGHAVPKVDHEFPSAGLHARTPVLQQNTPPHVLRHCRYFISSAR